MKFQRKTFHVTIYFINVLMTPMVMYLSRNYQSTNKPNSPAYPAVQIDIGLWQRVCCCRKCRCRRKAEAVSSQVATRYDQTLQLSRRAGYYLVAKSTCSTPVLPILCTYSRSRKCTLTVHYLPNFEVDRYCLHYCRRRVIVSRRVTKCTLTARYR